MSGRTFFFSLWCLGVAGLFVLGAGFAWSPFAEGGRARSHAGYYGPHHK
ncbi:hypothetical protein FHS95_000862 [Sphingomonas naasensis]|nr:hypothetical protein [Sphingomonas naasensis]NIJ19193.1 hypothetical protein [Sphingomonas naasensis]